MEKLKLEEYQLNGFIIIPNCITKESIESVFESTTALLRSYTSKTEFSCLFDRSFQNFEDVEFHHSLRTLREKDPKCFSSFYEACKLLISVKRLIIGHAALTSISTLLDVPENSLSMANPQLRFDFPKDTINWFGWHQENPYFDYDESKGGTDKDALNINLNKDMNITFWTPLVPVNHSNGSVRICVGSHKEGYFHGPYDWPHESPVAKSVVDKYKVIDVVANPGDLALFHGNLVHRSGDNTGETVRICTTVRIHSLLTEECKQNFSKRFALYDGTDGKASDHF